MKTELKLVTPAMARKWLRENTDNRPLRPSVVSTLAGAYGRGEWKITHQGIALAKSGRLLDGQHRLTFISELPDGHSVPVNVTTDMEEDSFEAIDIGVKRSMSDIYGASAGLVAAGRFVAKIHNGSSSEGLTNQMVKLFVDYVEPEYDMLVTFAPKPMKVWSSAAIRAAAIIQMKRGYDRDFIRLAYSSLVNTEIEGMPHAARALLQQHMGGKIVSSRSLDLFCRGLRVFDSNQKQRISNIAVKDQAGTLGEIRRFILSDMKKRPGKAGQVVAKPSAKFTLKAA